MATEILVGNCVSSMAALREKRFHIAVTSPPYLWQRLYGTDPVDWPEVTYKPMPGMPTVTVPAWRGELGGEPEPLAYVGHLVEVFRGVWRVLRDDGTLWVNVGDSYHNVRTHNNGGVPTNTVHLGTSRDGTECFSRENRNKKLDGIGEKNLLGIPWRAALALQSDGWVLRSEVIWHKPAPMPESVRDRPTRAHEQLFMFSKGPKYFYDATAIAETAECDRKRGPALHADLDSTNGNSGLCRRELAETRNARSVWAINSESMAEDHHAAFPTELPRRCILAGTSAHGVCALCGAPYVRVVERGSRPDRPGRVQEREGDSIGEAHGEDGRDGSRKIATAKTLGWEKTCKREPHYAWPKAERTEVSKPAPAEVLDPFGGSGRTAVAGWQTQRDVVLCEIREEYAEIARRQIEAAMQGQKIKRKQEDKAVGMGVLVAKATLGGVK